jgi:hypothetical protein
MKRLIIIFSIFSLIFLHFSTKSIARAATCTGSDLASQNILYPPSVRLDTPATLSIIGALPSLRNSTLYIFLWNPSTNSQALPGSVPISINADGAGIVTLDWGTLGPGLESGNYAIRIFDNPTNPFVPPCSPDINIQIVAEERTCVTFGDPCNYPADNNRIDQIEFCPEVGVTLICGSNGLWQSPPLSTFDYICVSPNPPTCRECEVFPDGTRECGDLSPERPVNCPAICAEEDTSATAFIVSRGCDEGEGTVNTAIGCIPFQIIDQTASFFLAWGLSVGGGIALLLIAISAIMFATSRGNPQKLEGAKSLFWAATTGLGMLALSVFLLRIIGVDVLGLFS